MKTNLKNIDTSNLPAHFPEVVEELEALKARVDDLQQSLPRVGGSTSTLESSRRDVLKAKLELDGLNKKHKDALGLDVVDASLHADLQDVSKARFDVAELFVEADALMEVVRPALKAMRDKAAGAILDSLEELHDDVKELMREVHGVFRCIPELGMTFAEWRSMTMAERASLREPGRPSAPLEALIIKTQRQLEDGMTKVRALSEGKINSVKAAIKGVELSKRGRPQASPLNKLDRELINLLKRLDEANNSKHGKSSASAEKTINRLLGLIEDTRNQIREGEAELSTVDAAKRKLEVLRAKHRDMVVEEVHATGENQSALLLAIIRNEDDQLTAVDNILKLDPEARVTVTHKVNPKDTRQRFERLRLNGQMKEEVLEELDRLERRQFTFAYSRNR